MGLAATPVPSDLVQSINPNFAVFLTHGSDVLEDILSLDASAEGAIVSDLPGGAIEFG